MVRKLGLPVAPSVAGVFNLAATVGQQCDHLTKEKCISSVWGRCVGCVAARLILSLLCCPILLSLFQKPFLLTSSSSFLSHTWPIDSFPMGFRRCERCLAKPHTLLLPLSSNHHLMFIFTHWLHFKILYVFILSCSLFGHKSILLEAV